MKTSTLSSTEVDEHPGAVDRRAPARHAVQLIGTLVVNAVLLVGGVRLTGFAWQDLCFLLLPPMVASAGAGVAFLVLNRMALQSLVPAVADLPPGHAHIAFNH
ncbi:MAG: hypothetical protein QOD10_2312 [Mycobacterium sp.]|nr:hypothetical protein [Mycobacterium sp.]